MFLRYEQAVAGLADQEPKHAGDAVEGQTVSIAIATRTVQRVAHSSAS